MAPSHDPSSFDHSPSPSQPEPKYSSPARVLATVFKKSRDLWKAKHQEIKQRLKAAETKIRDLSRSRQKWRSQAEDARIQVQNLTQQNHDLANQLKNLQAASSAPPQAPSGSHPCLPPTDQTSPESIAPAPNQNQTPSNLPVPLKLQPISLPAIPLSDSPSTLPATLDSQFHSQQPFVVTSSGLVAPRGHCYSLILIALALNLILFACLSLRSVARVLACFPLLGIQTNLFKSVPHFTTIRLWLLRFGHHALHAPKQKAHDWLWIFDHSNQLGPSKAGLLLGIRHCDWLAIRAKAMSEKKEREKLDSLGQSGPQTSDNNGLFGFPGLSLKDMEVLDLNITSFSGSTQEKVCEQFEAIALQTGVPMAIISDLGADIAGGVRLFQKKHPETINIYDAKHKAACLLKKQLEKCPRWTGFTALVGNTRVRLQQTDMVVLNPPSLRSKSRYMNLEELIKWGKETLELVKNPTGEILKHFSAEVLEEKLGWLREYEADLKEWTKIEQDMETTLDFVRSEGYHAKAKEDLEKAMEKRDEALKSSGSKIREALVTFVDEQSKPVKAGERLPGSSEVIESCFGKFKNLEGDHVKQGFTSLLLGMGACVKEATVETVAKAMEASKTSMVFGWLKEKLGQTMTSARRAIYGSIDDQSATKTEGNPIASIA